MNISIITVVFNGARTIEECLKSVNNQNHKNIEHIIVDGGSTDGTLDIIEKYSSNIAKVISESDNGIYDAMNKGLGIATGDIVGILNADDFYADENVLWKVAAVFNDQTIKCCYGDLVYVAENSGGRGEGRGYKGDGRREMEEGEKVEACYKVIRYWKSCPYNQKLFYRGWMPPHPTFFVRRSVYEKFGLFNLSLGSAADYELMLRFLLKYKVSTAYIPEVLVKMRTGGKSNASIGNRIKANMNDRKAWRVNGLNPKPWTLFMKPLSKVGQFYFRHKE